MAWQGEARHGWARPGQARQGQAWNLAWSGMAWQGRARPGMARNEVVFSFFQERQVNQYEIQLEGVTPIIMHQDILAFGEKVRAWQRDPANREHSVAGDDRSPPWTWLGFLYHNRKVVGIPSDNLMTMIREGGAKVRTGKGQETYKKHSQSGVAIDGEQFDLYVDGREIAVATLNDLIGNMDFNAHLEAAEAAGFELLVKRAKVGQSKHVRVRPMFRSWTAVGTLTVIDEELSGLTQPVLTSILNQAGAMCGLGDWRPSSPKSPGSFGKFSPEIKRL